MKQRSLIWSKLASTFVIAIAAGVTWAIVGFWGAYLITQLRESRPTIYERINVADNGTPVIDSQSVQQLQLDERSFRTLDGKPFFVKGRNWLSAAYFGKRLRPPAVFDFPISWRNRVVGLSDVQHPQTSWYFVRDAKSLGHAYFVGYDERAKLGVGWIGRNGFRRTIPPEDERFDVGLRSLDMNSGEIVSGAYYITPGVRAGQYVESENASKPPWVAFLIDGDRVLEINLRTRKVRTLYESPGMRSIAVVTEPAAVAESEPARVDLVEDADLKELVSARLPVMQVLARTSDHFVVLDRRVERKREFVIPQSLRDAQLSVYIIGRDELLLEQQLRPDLPTELTWLKPDGTIARHESLSLATKNQLSERTAFLFAGLVAPVPIAWTVVLGLIAPLGMLQSQETATFAEGLVKGFLPGWPELLLVIGVAALLAWKTYHLQKKHSRSGTPVWAAFVLLLGVPGFIAYWLERRRPKMETCAVCGNVVPRDRRNCAGCDAEFTPPARVGTEIFA